MAETPQRLRSLLACTLSIIGQDKRFIPASKDNKEESTYSKVLSQSQKGIPNLVEDYFQFADEIIKFFTELPKKPEYTQLMARSDSAMIQACVDVTTAKDVLPVSIVFVVQMPLLFGTLRPKEELNIAEAVITPPNSFMGVLHIPNRFFVKLIRIGTFNKTYNGHPFEIRDRNQNHGRFYEKPDRLKTLLYLGDCFSMYATPVDNLGEFAYDPTYIDTKITIFQSIQIIDNKGPSGRTIDPLEDMTGQFTRP